MTAARFVAVTLCLVPASVAGQAMDSVARAGGNGVYVWIGSVVSRAHPVDRVVAHRVERRRPNTEAWERVAEVSGVESARAFFTPLDSATRAAVRRALRRSSEQAAWDYIVRFPRPDSLAPLLGHEAIRLALGFYALDRNVRAGDRWQYRVTALDGDGRAGRMRTSGVVEFPARVTLEPVRVWQTESSEQQATVWWDVGRGRRMARLEVWRRRGTSGPFTVVDSLNTVQRVGDSLRVGYRDTGVTAGEAYQYYARPLDILFNPGGVSDTATVYAVEPTRLELPDSIVARGVDSLGIVLTWHHVTRGLARGFRVYRSEHQDSGWYRLAEVQGDARRLVDERVEPVTLYYYRLTVLGLNGEESAPTAAVFAYHRSRRAPLAPSAVRVGLAARGAAVRVAWQPNGEADLRGYYVYRTADVLDSVAATTPLQLVSPLLGANDTAFVDSAGARDATRPYTYVVRAVNSSNILSAPSAAVAAPLAGIARVSIPVPTAVAAVLVGTRVRVTWDDVAGTSPTASGYTLLRRTPGAGDTVYRAIATLAVGENAAWDSSVVAGRAYEYVVRTTDVAGRAGDPSASALARLTIGRPVTPTLVATAAPTGIELEWGDVVGLAARVRIYRNERGAAPTLLTETAGDTQPFVDTSAQVGRRYYYAVAFVVGGVEGERSNIVSARR
jgi:fibronectin type 3 domain-containing protein